MTVVDEGYTFIVASWPRDCEEINQLREHIPPDAGIGPFAGGDENAWHLLAYNNSGRPVGTARMQRDGRVDYIVVLEPWRGFTVGGALLSYLRHIAKCTRLESIWTRAPLPVEKFFTRNGFQPVSDDFENVGEGPRKMVRYVERTGAVHETLH